MQEVARHTVRCADCEDELADYRTLAVSLRSAVAMPDLTGFSATVLDRIEQLPRPLGVRVRRYLTSFSEGIGATIATGFAAAAVAVVTAVILTPYFRQAPFLTTSRAPGEIARNLPSESSKSATAQNLASADRQAALPPDVANDLTADSSGGVAPVLGPSEVSRNSGAIISRLEADSPSVAVWSEPQTDTTVIWVPDQPR
jgi:hypothetical protein